MLGETPLCRMQRKVANERRAEQNKGSLDIGKLLREARDNET